MKNSISLIGIIIFTAFSFDAGAQNVGIGTSTPDASAILELKSGTQGLLIPRMDSASLINIASPAKGLMVFDSSRNSFFYYNGASWLALAGTVSAADSIWAINPNGTGIQSLFYDSTIGPAAEASGDYSFAIGSGNIASGNHAMAMGRGNTSSNTASVAAGTNNSASGSGSVALGTLAEATGAYSIAAGNGSIASAPSAAAIGYANLASAEQAVAVGSESFASGNRSSALGSGLRSLSYVETVVGSFNETYVPNSTNSWNASDRVFSVGNGSADANRSNAFTILKNGNSGFGTSTPDTTLHVVGKFKYRDGTQADGYMLTSDADGNASWAALTSGAFEVSSGLVQPNSSVNMATDDFVFGSPSLDYSGNADHRSRFLFDKSKYAFRAGSATSGYWDSDQLGTYSVAFGDRNIASGSYSSAFGYDNQATGTSSTTFGEGNVASGSGSFIIGKDNESSGARGVAIGNSNVASGTGSVAVGRFAEGTASYSMALGYEVTASGYNSFAVGNYNTAYSAYEAVFGSYCTDYTPANANAFNNADRVFAVGNGTGNSNRSNALTILKNGNVGLGTDSPEATLHVDGTLRLEDGTQADGYVLTSDADGNASWQANTDNDTQDLSFSGTTLSLTDGGSVDLIGLSDNLGDHTATQTINTDNNWLSGDGGNEGIQIADNGGVTTSGTLSVGGIINTNTNWISGDGGSEGLQITDDGTVKFSSRINTNNQWITGDDNADEGIQIEDVGRVNVRAYVLGQDQFAMKIENTANTNSTRNDGLGIIAGHASYNSGQQSSFAQFTSPDGDYCGRIRQSGNNAVEYVSASDERLKENIRPTKYGLNDLMKIEVVDYNYRTDKPEDEQTGYLAQQLYTVFPHPVDVGGEDPKTQPWGVDYGAVSPLLVSATQELAKRTEQLEKENAWLKAENASLKGNYAALSSDVEMLKAILNTDTQVSK